MRRRSTFPDLVAAAAAFVVLLACSSARAQACCAGTGAVTPGRLALHETALVGIQAKAGLIFGSFNSGAKYVSAPSGASELDLEQDLFGAVRFLENGQAALLVPLVETRRTAQGTSDFGGGIGDVNASLRYDITLAGTSRLIPGIAVLAGVTAPTGKPPDASHIGPLAAGSTGVGAWQINGGVAAEQVFGPWLVNVTGILAQRTARTVGDGPSAVHERLGAQWTALAAVAYTFPNEMAVAASASLVLEGNATIGGVDSNGTAHRLPTLTLSGVAPLSDTWRLQGALFDNLPITPIGLNQPAGAGVLVTVIHSWT